MSYARFASASAGPMRLARVGRCGTVGQAGGGCSCQIFQVRILRDAGVGTCLSVHEFLHDISFLKRTAVMGNIALGGWCP